MSAPLFFIRTVIARDGKFLAVTLASCTVAAIVAMFQYTVYTSFVRASAVVPRMLGGDFWVTAASVECFDFPNPFNEDYAGVIMRYVPGAQFRRVVFGFATWRSPAGKRGNVALIGVEGLNLPDNGFAVDRSDLGRLDLEEISAARVQLGSISDTTLHLDRIVDNLPTFLGAPYVIVPFDRGRELLRMDPSSTSFLIGDIPDRKTALTLAARNAARDFPEITMLPAQDFSDSSAQYWQKKTGAGMAILLAAALAGLLMAILLTNGVLRFIQRYHHDLVSLLGHGASQREITAIVGGIATLVAVITMVGSLLVTPVLIILFRPLLPWVSFSPIDALVPLITILLSLGLALVASKQAISAYGPDIVFRS